MFCVILIYAELVNYCFEKLLPWQLVLSLFDTLSRFGWSRID